MPDATLFQITARHRARQFMPTSLSDFTTDGGTRVDAALILDPQWSLYSLGLEGNLAIFVRLPDRCDLSRFAFIPQAQFDAAEQVLTLALDDLPALAEALPRPPNLIFLFSIGRCGTTLANHILNTVPDTFALSEPRAYVILALARHQMPQARAQALIAAVTRLMFRPPQGHGPYNFAVKFHSQVLYQADLLHRAFPQAKSLFLYRDARGWANSFSRFQQDLRNPRLLDPDRLATNWRLLTADAPLSELAATIDVTAPLTPHPPFLASVWAHNLLQFRRLRAAGLPFHVLRYDDLTSDREASIRALLAHCDLPDINLSQALETFDRDSQEGTAIARGSQATGFDEVDYTSLVRTLARTPDPIPGDIRL